MSSTMKDEFDDGDVFRQQVAEMRKEVSVWMCDEELRHKHVNGTDPTPAEHASFISENKDRLIELLKAELRAALAARAALEADPEFQKVREAAKARFLKLSKERAEHLGALEIVTERLEPAPGEGVSISDTLHHLKLAKLEHKLHGKGRFLDFLLKPIAVFMTFADILRQPLPVWLVKDILQKGSFAIVTGKQKSGKSFLTKDMVLALCRGQPEWFNLKLPGRPLRALYISGEGLLSGHIAAYKKHHGLDDVPGFVAISRAFKLTKDGAALLVSAIEDYEELYGQFDVIVIDTLNRSYAGSENKDEDMNIFVDGCDALKDGGRRTVIVVHHLGKNEGRGSRGSSVLPAAVDTEIRIECAANGTDRSFEVFLQRNGESGTKRGFKLEPIPIGKNEDGEEVTSCYVEPTEGVPQAKAQGSKPKKLPAQAQIALDALQDAIRSKGEVLPATSVLPGGKRGVRVEEWREKFYSKNSDGVEIDRSNGPEVKAFKRARDVLLAEKVVGIHESFVWIW